MPDTGALPPARLREPPARLREDVVVSVCFSDLPATDAAFRAVRDLSDSLDAHYRFREIILIVDDAERDSYLPLVQQVPDLRLFAVRPGSGYYDRRVIAAEEAIGDIVLIGSAEEMAHLDLLALLEQAERTNSIVLATRSERRQMRTGLSSPIIALGRLAGFKVNLNDLQSIAMPRTLLNQLISHGEPELALRFPPRDPRFPLDFFFAEQNVPSRKGLGKFQRRVQLLQKLLVYLAPSILMLVSISSTILALLGIGYAFYVVGAWFVVENLAPGWLTTSAMLSLSAAFMGLSMLGLSLGMQQLLNRQNSTDVERVADEINRIDLFGKVASDLNVELESDAPPAPQRNPG
ncbi:hypothetical protein CDO87_26220 (plasmid) [Sagittula sp. P11]|uniref:glycosyltransferase n=1 Tax=unclassified Sagittula TaxID=2624628 RepID=UPI000C2D39AB|nr:glycosyltransferase [Sagittula sp. P11]AUC56771.1 hypothetical protein CDO87_26220 [Sagittula sp. P11]